MPLRSVPATTSPVDSIGTIHNGRNRAVKNVAQINDEPHALPHIPEEPTTPQKRTVHHWARVWIGKSTTVNGRFFVAWEQYEDVEVAVQQYGDPHWIEDLFTNMITVAKEYLEDIPEEYSTVRLRVNLYSHRSDSGENAKFTLERMERRSTPRPV